MEFEKSVNFHHFFLIRAKSSSSHTSVKSNKTTYAELLGLSKKLIDYAMKTNLEHELLNTFKTLIHDAQNGNQEKENYLSDIFNQEEENYLSNVFNPVIIKHKGKPPKRLKASIENDIYKDKRVLVNSSNNITENIANTNGRKCSKCKRHGHYAKTCQYID